MPKLKIKDGVNLEELEKFGFKRRYRNCYEYSREIQKHIVYRVYTTPNHGYIQVEVFEPMIIAGSLQCLIYELVQANLIEIEKESNHIQELIEKGGKNG